MFRSTRAAVVALLVALSIFVPFASANATVYCYLHWSVTQQRWISVCYDPGPGCHVGSPC